MKIFVDVDGTLIGQDKSLRKGSLKTLNILQEMGCELSLWSYGGDTWARFWNDNIIKFPFVNIFDKREPKFLPDLAIDNDGIGVPKEVLTYWCDNYVEKGRGNEDLSDVIRVVKEYQEKGGLTEEFIKSSHIDYLFRFEKLRFSDYSENDDEWKSWNIRKYFKKENVENADS